MGFRVSKPYGDSDRYDFVVDTGTRLVRVQVKSSSRLSQETYFIASQRCSNGVAIPYRVDEIDFLAAYVFLKDAWFIIPVEAFVPRTGLHLFPRERERWGYMPGIGRHGVCCRSEYRSESRGLARRNPTPRTERDE